MEPAPVPSRDVPVAPLVVIGGPPGSGKSTVGALLARATGAALLDQDTVTNPLITQIAALTGAGDDLDHPSLRGAVRDARYACLRDTAAEISALGCPVIVVAPFTAELGDPVAWQQFCEPLPGAVLVAVTIDPAESLRRRQLRGLPRDRKLSGPAGAASEPVLGDHIAVVVDGARSGAELVDEIRRVAGLGRR